MLMDHQHKKMLLISSSSTTHDWPQIDDEDDDLQNCHNKGVMGSTTTAAVGGGGGGGASCSTRLMEKPGQEQLQQQQQQALKCPRCDSSNTKFCYYNNYSLSQPRHFCKACKRYWTRGGTLRNVPVGGGCRKNKRVKRPTSSSATVDNNGASSSASSAPPPSSGNNNSNQHIDLLTSVANSNQHRHMNPLFYGDHHHLGFTTSSGGGAGFDQFSALGLGFGGDHQRLINPASTAKQIQDLVAASSLHHASNHPIFNSSTSAFGTAPTTMASVLASKFINGGFKDVRAVNNNQGYFQNLLPFEGLQIAAAEAGGGGGEGKEVKVEENRINMGSWSSSNHLQTEQQMGGLSSSTDPTTLYWSSSSSNNNNLGANNWHDPAANLGSSVSSLI